MNRFQFVDDHQRHHSVKRLCQIIGIARSSYYHWKANAPDGAARAAADTLLGPAFAPSTGTPPAPTAPRGSPPNCAPPGRWSTTSASPGSCAGSVWSDCGCAADTAPPSPTRTPPRSQTCSNRTFIAQAPNTRYVGDITYLPIAAGTFLYLATVMDLCSRRLVGWTIAEHMRAELLLDALHTAEHTRGSLARAVFHSDHGAQYNAAAESLNASFKRETL